MVRDKDKFLEIQKFILENPCRDPVKMFYSRDFYYFLAGRKRLPYTFYAISRCLAILKSNAKKDLVVKHSTHQIISIQKIKGYEDYAVSEDGKIYSLRKNKMKELKPQKERSGYYNVKLYNNGKVETCKVRKLVADAFLPNIYNSPYLISKNFIKKDCRVCNLEWCTLSENKRHVLKTGLLKKGAKRGAMKISKPVKGINIKTGEEINFKSIMDAERNGFHNCAIVRCCRGERKKHKGYTWEYI